MTDLETNAEGSIVSINSKLKRRLAVPMLAFCLFGLPNAPGSALVPTVGGDALAYAPCSMEAAAASNAAADHLDADSYGSAWTALIAYITGVTAYANCVLG